MNSLPLPSDTCVIRKTVEARWFFRHRPFEIGAFFDTTATPATRTDWYSLPCGPRSGMKVRQGRLEAKLLVAELSAGQIGLVAGRIERWSKWSFQIPTGQGPTDSDLATAGWVAVEKKRYMRNFTRTESGMTEVTQPSASGCDFELTEIIVRGQPWWTVGFEAVDDQDDPEANLRMAVETVFQNESHREPFCEASSFGYPVWLSRLP